MLKSLFEPKEKKALSRGKVAARILLIIVIALIGYTLFTLKKTVNKDVSSVLGSTEQIKPQPEINKESSSTSLNALILGSAHEIVSDASTLGNEALQSAMEVAKKETTKIIIQQTALTVMSQIEKLPKSEQDQIKNALCK